MIGDVEYIIEVVRLSDSPLCYSYTHTDKDMIKFVWMANYPSQ